MPQSLPIPDGHSWSVADGYKLVVANRGVVIIQVPQDWEVTVSDDGVLQVTDAPSPADDCRIEVSPLPLPMVPANGIGLEEVAEMMADAVDEDGSPMSSARVITVGTTQMVRLDGQTVDVNNGRTIDYHQLIGAGPTAFGVVTFSVYQDEQARFAQTLDHLIATVRFGERRDLRGQDASQN